MSTTRFLLNRPRENTPGRPQKSFSHQVKGWIDLNKHFLKVDILRTGQYQASWRRLRVDSSPADQSAISALQVEMEYKQLWRHSTLATIFLFFWSSSYIQITK